MSTASMKVWWHSLEFSKVSRFLRALVHVLLPCVAQLFCDFDVISSDKYI